MQHGPHRTSHHRHAATAIRQADILSELVLARRLVADRNTFEEYVFPLAIVLTQNCDLAQDHRVRFAEPPKLDSDKLIPSVLLAEVHTATDTLSRIAGGRRKEWDRLNIQANANPRFHFLQSVPADEDRLRHGLPELVVDFKRYFAVATEQLYLRISDGETNRQCVLVSPYLEHLAQRFVAYLSRVGLPTDHASE